MNRREFLGVGQGLAHGFDQGMKNFVTTVMAKEKLNQSRESFEREKKIADLKLKGLEAQYGPDAIAAIEKENKLKLKAADANLAMWDMDLNKKRMKSEAEMQRAKAGLDQWTQIAQGVLNPNVQADTGLGIKIGGTQKTLTPYQQRGIDMNKRQAIEALRTGKYYDKNKITGMGKINGPDDFIAYATEQGVDLNDPDVKKAMADKQAEDPRMDFKSYLGSAENYSEEQERMIQANVDHYRRPREEIIAALKKQRKL